jgi:hypothetical protein
LALEALKTASTTLTLWLRIPSTVIAKAKEVMIMSMGFHGLQDLTRVASAKGNSDLLKLWAAI